MWTFAKFLSVVAACYVMVAAWLYFNQKKMLYYPRADHVGTPGEIGLPHEDVTLINRLGTRLHAWWLPREDDRFTVLFSHGNAGNVSHRLDTLRIFHELGLSVLIYDYSGYGKSEGEPSEEATAADARAAWDWLVKEQGIRPGRIVLFGRSLGGAVTAQLAAELAQEDGAAGMIMESTFSSVPDMGAVLYPWLPVRSLARYRYDSVKALEGVAFPALFAHSREDEIVAYELGARLYESYGGPKYFLEMKGSHNSGYLTMGEAYAKGLERFLARLENRP